MRNLVQDLRYAARLLARQPAFTLLAVLTLAVGVGAPIAVFTVFNAVLLRPLPYTDAARLVVIRADAPDGKVRAALADAEVADLREATRLFEDVAGLTPANGDLTTRDGELPMERVSAASATDNLLPILGVKAAFGRLLDNRLDSGSDRVLSVVISHELWRRRYGSDPTMIGRHVEINNRSVAVVGILPQGFRLHFGHDTTIPSRVDVWFPTGLTNDRRFRVRTTVARMASGVTLDQARAELSALANRISAANVSTYGNRALRLHADSLQSDAAREITPVLLALLGAVAFVLLISSANVAHLLLTRTNAREREIAVRSAIGAGRGRLVRQLLTEGALLGCAGGAGGLMLATWGELLLTSLRPATLPAVHPTIDGRVLGFALVVTIGTSLLVSVAPAMQALRTNMVDALKAGGRSQAMASRRIRTVLIVSEVALTVVLLASAGLMIRSAASLRAVDTGFDGRGVLTMRASFNARDFQPTEKRWAFYREAMERLRALPSVQSVSAVRPLPLEGAAAMLIERVVVDERPTEEIAALSHTTLPGYFSTMRIQMLQGRDFDAADMDAQRAVVIVDERFAASAWPGKSPLGRSVHIRRAGRDLASAEVIGIVNHVRAISLRDERQPQVYFPYHRYAVAEMAVTIRTAVAPALLVNEARGQIESLGGNRPVYEIREMRTYVDEAAAESRFLERLLGVFAVIALVLATVGLYGVVAYTTAQRTREIGLRVAVGATPADILRLVIGDGLKWTGVGIAIGVVAATNLAQWFEALLFGVAATDPPTFFGVTVLLAVVAFLASFIPARRATRVDPLVALHCE